MHLEGEVPLRHTIHGAFFPPMSLFGFEVIYEFRLLQRIAPAKTPAPGQERHSSLEDRAGGDVTNCLAKPYSERVSMAQIQIVGDLATCSIATRL
jgi:hypothetical protein